MRADQSQREQEQNLITAQERKMTRETAESVVAVSKTDPEIELQSHRIGDGGRLLLETTSYRRTERIIELAANDVVASF